MRRLLVVLGLACAAGAAPDADQYFDLGLEYLRKGFFARARSAFSESLVRAPGQPVPMAFLAVASAAEGRPAGECAVLLRWAYRRLPKKKGLRLDLRTIQPSARAVELLQKDYRRRLRRATGERRRQVLTVLAFLEVQDGDPVSAPALDLLLKETPADAYALALARLRKKKPSRPGGAERGSSTTSPPTSSGPSSARAGSSSGRS